MNTLTLDALAQRRSVPITQLTTPGPDEATLIHCLQAAIRVPDHGRLVPFRFIRIQGEARQALSEAMAALHQRIEPGIAPKVLDKDRTRFTFAPVAIAVIACYEDHPKVPRVEQLLSAGSVAFQLLQAVQTQGFAGNWLTGWAAYDETVRQWLGVNEHEDIVGFIHIGTPKLDVPERDRPDAASLLTEFDPASIQHRDV